MNYRLVRSRRRKRTISLQVDSSGTLVVRSPLSTPISTIEKFIYEKSKWIKKRRISRSLAPLAKLSPDDFYQKSIKLHDYIEPRIRTIANKIGVSYSRYEIKNVTSYWGNCNSKRVIHFNARLIDYPSEAIDYVIVHELCHLRHRGHGKRFWKLVESHFPTYIRAKKLLRLSPISSID